MTEMTIIVEFETLEGAEPEFTRIINDHAQRTLAEEPGCRRFEVVKPLEDDGSPIPNRLLVNELYADAEALAVHDANPRLATVRETIKPLLKSRRRILAKSLAERAVDEGRLPSELNAANDG